MSLSFQGISGILITWSIAYSNLLRRQVILVLIQLPWCVPGWAHSYDTWALQSCDYTKAIVANPEYPLKDERLIIDVVKKGMDLHHLSVNLSNHQSSRFGQMGGHLLVVMNFKFQVGLEDIRLVFGQHAINVPSQYLNLSQSLFCSILFDLPVFCLVCNGCVYTHFGELPFAESCQILFTNQDKFSTQIPFIFISLNRFIGDLVGE